MVFGASRAGVGADTRAQGDIDPSACIETSSHAPRQEPLSRKTKPKDVLDRITTIDMGVINRLKEGARAWAHGSYWCMSPS